MGTSQSKPPAPGGSPLIPSWADQDPPPAGTPPPAPPPNQGVLPPRRNAGLRRSLGQYYASGDERYARRALGHFARSSMGGGSAAGDRLARAARIGGGAFAALGQAGAGQAAPNAPLDLRSLAGRPIAEAITAIVDAFCPPGILDEDAIRAAMSEALAEALAGPDPFDPTKLDDYAVLVAARCFVAELVFNAVISEQGAAAADVSPVLAVQRENRLREIVREVTDLLGTPVISAAGAQLSAARVEALVKEVATVVLEDVATW